MITNTAGSLIGEGAARGIAAGARAFHRNFEVVVDRSSVTLGANLSDPGIRIRRRVDAPNTSLKNRSGNLAETAQKARTQPHLGRPTPPAPKFNPADFAGKPATTPPHLPAGQYPALVIDGKVFVGRMHNTAFELAGRKGVEQFYGFAEIDAAGNVVRLFK